MEKDKWPQNMVNCFQWLANNGKDVLFTFTSHFVEPFLSGKQYDKELNMSCDFD